ncbi:MAG: HvfX family Cu-binding RiPP maturation protein [Gammaproteobacteria bacterium]
MNDFAPSNKTQPRRRSSALAGLRSLLNESRSADFIAPLALRLYLFPVMWMAGTEKLSGFSNTVEWFGNPDWGLGLPVPWLMAALATGTELAGALSLALGFAVRWMSIPLMITMLVAAFKVHWANGWLAIASGSGLFATERTLAAIERLNKVKEILHEYGDYDWLTEYGNLVMLNNGIEFAATYFIMLLVLFFIGAGRYVSLDYWIDHRFNR